jgi:hypothetical protein
MDKMVELVIHYEDFDGELKEQKYMVPETLKTYIDALIDETIELKEKSHYWKRMMGFHVSEGVGAN